MNIGTNANVNMKIRRYMSENYNTVFRCKSFNLPSVATIAKTNTHLGTLTIQSNMHRCRQGFMPCLSNVIVKQDGTRA